MNITETIKVMMTNKGVKLTQLNDMLNNKNNTNYTVQNLSRRLNNNDMKFGDVSNILDVLGYKISIIEDKSPNSNTDFNNCDTLLVKEQNEDYKCNKDKVSEIVVNKMTEIIEDKVKDILYDILMCNISDEAVSKLVSHPNEDDIEP